MTTTPAPSLAWIDGAVVPVAEARVPVLDRGFLFGDHVFEVARTAGGRVVDGDAHLDRLAASAARLGFAAPPRATIVDAIAAILAAAGPAPGAGGGDHHLRIIVTRGDGDVLDAAPTTTRLVILCRPLVLPTAAAYAAGCVLVTVDGLARHVAAAKTGNFLASILAKLEARRAGADEALLRAADGRILEGASSNLFVVRTGRVLTPPADDDILPGVTRARLIALARAAGVAVDERAIDAATLGAADEVFVTSSVRGVMPARQVDGRAVAAPGPLTRALAARYDRFLTEVATGV